MSERVADRLAARREAVWSRSPQLVAERRVVRLADWLTLGALIGAVIVFGFPFVWLLAASLRPPHEIHLFPPTWYSWPPHPESYLQLWTVMPFGRYLLNSLVSAVGAVALQAVTVPLAAYAFARLHFPFRNVLFVAYLGAMMVPIHVTIFPTFLTLSTLGWLDTYLALWIPFGTSAFGTFWVRQAFLTIPGDLSDAARIDGATHLQILLYIMVPLAQATILTFLLLSFTWRWNEYLWPLIMTTSREMRTLPLALAMLRASEGYAQWHLIMAGTVIAFLPPVGLFVVFQRQLSEGMAQAGVGR